MALLDTPTITVNGAVIPTAAIDAEVQYHPASDRRQAMVKAAESLIIAELIAQKANALGISKQADRDLLNNEPDLVDKLMASEIQFPNASEAECAHYYEQNKERFKTPALIEANHVLLAASPDDLESRAQMKALAEQLLSELQSKQLSFADAARKYSMCPSKESGGNLGQLSHGQTVPEFERQVFASNEGLVPKPIESRYGFHIVEVVRKVEGEQLPYEAVEQKIKDYLDEKVHRKAISQYLHLLVSESEIEGFNFDFDDSMLMQ